MLYPKQTIRASGRLLDLRKPQVMGILNVTPDSFFDGGKYTGLSQALRQIEKMLLDGATIIDVGGMSSRPGAVVISSEEECQRVLPIIEAAAKQFSEAIFSIDTVYAHTARMAVRVGAHMVNDISAGQFDPTLLSTVADLRVPYILMHMQGRPEDMQVKPTYEDVTLGVLDFFIKHIQKLKSLGIADIIIDPGFGFGKSKEHNYALLQKMHVFKVLDCPLLAGISRKSMIYKVLRTQPNQALNGTTALHMVALQQGARILRVHDVKEAVEVVTLWEQLESVN